MLNQTEPTVKLESALHGILLTQFDAAQNRRVIYRRTPSR